MEHEHHEDLLAELNQPELEQTRKTEILTELREDYNGMLKDFGDLTQTNDKLKKSNDDLVVANSKLFRESGYTKKDGEDEIDKKEFSETITISQLKKGLFK